MKRIKTTVAALRKATPEEIAKMVDESDHPEFVKRMLDEIKSRSAEPGHEKAFIQWGFSQAPEN